MRIDRDGNVMIGATSTLHKFTVQTDGATNFMSSYSFGGFDGGFAFYCPRGTQASPTANSAADPLGSIYFGGWDTAISNSARIYAVAAADFGTAGDASDSPGELRFATVPDGSGTLVDRIIIRSGGNVGVGVASPTDVLEVGGALRVTGAIAGGNGSYANIAYDGNGIDIFSQGPDATTRGTVTFRQRESDSGNLITSATLDATGMLTSFFGLTAKASLIVDTETKTLASDAFAITATTKVWIKVLPESGTTDNINSITGGTNGQIIILSTSGSTHTLTVKHKGASGNISLNGSVDFAMAHRNDSVTLMWNSTMSLWQELGRADSS